MRTMIELPDEWGARLLALGARRGERGLSSVVVEALERYLAEEDHRRAIVPDALSAIGSLDVKEADRMRASRLRLRSSWRSS